MEDALKKLPRASRPEDAGVSSSAVVDFLKELESMNYIYHSLMVIHKGVVAAECYRYPFNEEEPHCMYSISKHVTATALGFAVDEGKISLDTKISDIFPDKIPKNDPAFKELTILHLVTMTSGKNPSALLNKSKGNWFSHFSEAPRKYAPGEAFQYVNECIYVLSACLKKVLGEGINDYLVPRLWSPLGIDKPFWETDENGIEAGGWGIQLKTEDLAKFALCYHNEGKLFGKQIIPKDWISRAVLNQTPACTGGLPDKSEGYGYSVWRYTDTRWHFEGMFGQEAQIFDDLNLILVVTSCEFFPKRKNEAFDKYAHLMVERNDERCISDEEYKAFIASRVLDEYKPCDIRPAEESFISGKTIRFGGHPLLKAVGFPLGMLHPAAVFMSKNRAGNINDAVLDFDRDCCRFTWRENEESNTVRCRMTGGYYADKIRLAGIDFVAYSAARWLDNTTLELKIRPMQAVAGRVLTFKFKKNRVVLDMHVVPSLEETLRSILNDFCKGIRNASMRKFVFNRLLRLGRMMEPKTRGKIVKQ